jgi:hypothetical protein
MSRTLRVLAGLLIALAALAVIASYAGTVALQRDIAQHRAVMACYSAYNTTVREALVARDRAARIEREAQRALLTAAAEPGPIEPAVIDEYLDALVEADALRAEYPLPVNNFCLPRSP